MRTICTILLLLSVFCNTAYAEYVVAKVIKVTDGDTVTMQYDDIVFKVRLYCIDAPEINQEYGQESKALLTHLTLNKEFTLELKDKDQYGRIVGVIYEPIDGLKKKNINLEMVRNGLAWAYDRCTVFEYMRSQYVARKKKLGLWQNAAPAKPWDYRRRN
ncbi:MAG: thermonuclease family protein [Geovibrio sp.]|nr:thermonuclease family protein [Geovibrio sp.]